VTIVEEAAAARETPLSLAHSDFRDDLEREARVNGLIPRSFR
jgi:acyl-CoA hydrolase